MEYYKHKDFIKSVYNLYCKNATGRHIATNVLAIMMKTQANDFLENKLVFDKINKISQKNHGIQLLDVYDMSGHRLLIAKRNGKGVFVLLGNALQYEQWVKHNKNLDFDNLLAESEPLSHLLNRVKKTTEEPKLSAHQSLTMEIPLPEKSVDSHLEQVVKQSLNNLLTDISNNIDERAEIKAQITKTQNDIKIYQEVLEFSTVFNNTVDLDDNFMLDHKANMDIINISTNDRVYTQKRTNTLFDLISDKKFPEALEEKKLILDTLSLVELKIKHIQLLENLILKNELAIKLKNKKKAIFDIVHSEVAATEETVSV